MVRLYPYLRHALPTSVIIGSIIGYAWFQNNVDYGLWAALVVAMLWIAALQMQIQEADKEAMLWRLKYTDALIKRLEREDKSST